MDNNLRIAVIDSGVDASINFETNTINRYSVKRYFNTYQVIKDKCRDEIGHGTAIINILNTNLNNISFSMFKIYDAILESEEERLIFTLNHILHCDSFNIVHISSGLTQPQNYYKLYNVCKSLYEKGVIIVSAFDNDGSVSYPAAFPFVIGVDLSDRQLALNEYEYVENSIINIRASAAFHRLKWISPPTMLAQGTSFSSAYITILVARLRQNSFYSFCDILNNLKINAVRSYDEPTYSLYDDAFIHSISKAIVFPFNKEIHSLAMYRNLLSFEIVGFYDIKYSMNVGKSICELLPHIKTDDKIKDINELVWDSNFDTIILGHCSTLNSITKKDWSKHVINNALRNGKRIYAFDPPPLEIADENMKHAIYYPRVDLDMVPKNRFGKLRSIGKPILGIFGTSSQQGKFTLQLILRNMFNLAGYKVAQIGTEPQSPLFGIDRVFPIGFNSTVRIHGIQSITLLNEYMWDIAQNEPDIILVGSQSGTVPFSFNHLSQFPIYQNDFLLGTQPDYVLLCINPHDTIEYIIRSIKYIEGLIDTHIIALVMYPIIQDVSDIGNRFQKRKLNNNEVSNIIKEIQSEIDINIYLLSDESHMKKLFEQIIQTFSGSD